MQYLGSLVIGTPQAPPNLEQERREEAEEIHQCACAYVALWGRRKDNAGTTNQKPNIYEMGFGIVLRLAGKWS